MKLSIAQGLRCPACFSALELHEEAREEDIILEGLLACSGCGRQYPIRDGIPVMLVEEAVMPQKDDSGMTSPDGGV